MFSKESLKKYNLQLLKAIEMYDQEPVENLKICVSNGNKKVGSVPNVSLPPIKTCPHCERCCRECYDIKANLQYENVRLARARNYSILTRDPALYWSQLRSKLARKRKLTHFRFHVGGDMTTPEYFSEMVETARMFPKCIFWTYTKAHFIVNEYVRSHGGSIRSAIPGNLRIMFSAWDGMKFDNPFGFGSFIVVDEGQKPPKGVWHCTGDCGKCIKANRGCPVGETAWVWKH